MTCAYNKGKSTFGEPRPTAYRVYLPSIYRAFGRQAEFRYALVAGTPQPRGKTEREISRRKPTAEAAGRSLSQHQPRGRDGVRPRSLGDRPRPSLQWPRAACSCRSVSSIDRALVGGGDTGRPCLLSCRALLFLKHIVDRSAGGSEVTRGDASRRMFWVQNPVELNLLRVLMSLKLDS